MTRDAAEPEDGGMTRELTHEERMFLSRIEGLFVGMLDEAEAREFERLVKAGVAARSYEGAGGFMGLAKVRRMAA